MVNAIVSASLDVQSLITTILSTVTGLLGGVTGAL